MPRSVIALALAIPVLAAGCGGGDHTTTQPAVQRAARETMRQAVLEAAHSEPGLGGPLIRVADVRCAPISKRSFRCAAEAYAPTRLTPRRRQCVRYQANATFDIDPHSGVVLANSVRDNRVRSTPVADGCFATTI